jgi:hypothetical protein
MSVEEMRKEIILKYGRIIRGQDVMKMCDYQVLAIHTKMVNMARNPRRRVAARWKHTHKKP